MSKMSVKPSKHSAVTALLDKFTEADIDAPGERKFTFGADKQRDTQRPVRLASDLGARIQPIRQPKRRKPGSKPINQIKRRETNHKITEVICVVCGAVIQAKSKKRMYCDDRCKNNANVKKARAERERKGETND